MSGSDLRERLVQALAGTTDTPPRPLIDLDLPAGAERLMDDRVLSSLCPAAVLVPVLERPQGLRVLFTVRGDNLRTHAGQISFPGGRRDPGDLGPVDNALRESREEVGLDAAHVDVVGFLDDYPTVTGFRVTPVVGLVSPAARVAADGVEVVDTFEVPLAYLLDRRNYQRRWLERGGLRLPYYALTHGRRFIWGATAGMLRNLTERVEAAPRY